MADQKLAIDHAGDRLGAMLASFKRLTGNSLADDANGLWHAPGAIVAHDTSDDPEFFFANACALTLFKMDIEDFLGMPSQKSAEPAEREERAAMLAKLEADDVVEGYCGVRVAADGSRFKIIDAVVWNIRDEDGRLLGQAAWFEDMDFLD
ncbi:MEKHLA domain-containing protein [Aurantiacibacter sp. MUD11]|uniref:MEKHLA domain-containing protein n=1 Tax=Aurantiacibacter sp. MUD11 TaxID=3003265 RepID=UPI0022AA3462|nr:MEKHLA domain-containing protein [Aurantiacibacter sp. MUD11]WAT17904.1 MEKHLA domain-containing protein [Aurantiacibacter sp. MUD11]